MNISVIAPTYNNPEEIKLFLDSLNITEKQGELELIIVDDSSDRKVEEVIQDTKVDFPVKYFKLKRQFIGEKRNFGARKAKYELLFFIDSDITFEKNALKILLQSLSNHPEIAMFAGTIMQDDKQLHPTKNDRLIKKDDIVLAEVIYSAYLATYKSIFLKLGGYDSIFENRGEGTDLSIKYWRAGYPLARNLRSVVYHPAFKAARKSPERIAEMYRSLYLVGYKYGLSPEKNPHLMEMYEEREAAYGKTLEFYCIFSTAKYIDWFIEHRKELQESQKEAEKLSIYDFKPFDVFSDKKLLDLCLAKSTGLIKQTYQKATL